MAEDIFSDDKAEIEQLEKPQREDKGTPAPAEKPEPAQAATEPQAPPPDTEDEVEIENKGRFVRYGALREAREQNKALKEERDRIQSQYATDAAKFQERLALLIQAQQKPVEQARAPELPPLETDPVGHLQGRIEQTQAQLREATEWRQQQQAHQDQSNRMVQVQRIVEQNERDYAVKQTDYYDAQKFLTESWAKEAQAIGYDPQQAIAARTIETIQLAANNNRNPAEVAYLLAKTRGYAGPAPVQPQAAPQQSDAEIRLTQVAAGQQAARSGSSMPASTVAGSPGLEALANMSDDEFSLAVDGKNWEKIKQQMLNSGKRFN